MTDTTLLQRKIEFAGCDKIPELKLFFAGSRT